MSVSRETSPKLICGVGARHVVPLPVLLILLLGLISSIAAQTPSPPAIVPRQEAIIRAGPGQTYKAADRLNWADSVKITARNRIGNWVKIAVPRGENVVEGWVVTGFLDLDDSIHLSDIPVDDSLPDAVPENVNSQSQAELYSVDVLPRLSEAMRDVYARGQAQGNHADVITKIGDSLSASRVYLTPMSRDDAELGPYDFLAGTVRILGRRWQNRVSPRRSV